MDFSFYLPCYWPDTRVPAQDMYAEMLAQARHAEDLGFATLSVPEHHFINYLTHPNPLLTAVQVAAATRHIPIITAVLVLPFRDMRLLAGEIAQADCMTGGRLQIGVGRGAFRYEFDRLGVPVEESRERFDDALALLRALLTETEVSWDSPYYSFPSLTITPRPLQTPHPPLWIAAISPAAIYHSVLNGYHVMTTPLREPFEAAMSQTEAFLKGVAEVGPAAASRQFSMLRMLYVAADEADAHEKIEIAWENDRHFSNVFDSPGDVRDGSIVPVETGRSLEDVAENLLIGTASEIVERLKPYAEIGIPDLVLNMSFGASHRDVMGSLDRFAKDVMPHFARKPDLVGAS